MRLAVEVEHRRRRVGAEPHGAGLVRGRGDVHASCRGTRCGGAVSSCMPEVAEHRVELLAQPLQPLGVVRLGSSVSRTRTVLSIVTRFSGWGRSSELSQKSTAW